jgi:hypothetical protein
MASAEVAGAESGHGLCYYGGLKPVSGMGFVLRRFGSA